MPVAAPSIAETWAGLCEDPALQGRPYKIETDEYGRILMSPTKNYHGFYASRINRLLDKLMPDGETGNEVGILTAKGVKVPDSIWASPARYAIIIDEAAASISPEICVEVLSIANTRKEVEDKRQLYFDAGAKEVWLCHPDGAMEFFARSGTLQRSLLCPAFPLSIK